MSHEKAGEAGFAAALVRCADDARKSLGPLVDYVRRVIEQIERRKLIGKRTIRLDCAHNLVLDVRQLYNLEEFFRGLYSAANSG